MEKKYKLTEETINVDGITLYRIEALIDFGDVKKGDKGGFVENDRNLSHDGNCWVYGNAKVYEKAQVCNNAKVYGNAKVCDITYIYGNAKICGNAKVYGNMDVYGNTKFGE